jgi:hypothetical protein
MNKALWIGVGAIAVATVGGVIYFHHKNAEAPVETASAPPEVAAAGTAPETPAESPVAEAASSGEPGPQIALADSDQPVQGELEKLFGKSTMDALLIPEKILRHIVATIESLDGEPVALRLRPVHYVEGLLAVDSGADGITLSAENARRYATYVNALQAVDSRQLVAFYRRHYTLFQKAYDELGYSGHSFNQRLIKIIDHLLATPEVPLPIKLVRAKVLYEYEDSSLEQRSSGQKILIRMGSENAAVIKAAGCRGSR